MQKAFFKSYYSYCEYNNYCDNRCHFGMLYCMQMCSLQQPLGLNLVSGLPRFNINIQLDS